MSTQQPRAIPRSLKTAGDVHELLKDREALQAKLKSQISYCQKPAKTHIAAADNKKTLETHLAIVEANIRDLRNLKLAEVQS